MGKFIAALTLAAVAAGSFSAAEASDSYKRDSLSKTVVSGERTKMGDNWHINNDCSLANVPFARIVQAPKHGRLEIVRQPIFPQTRGSLQRCRTVKVMGITAYYKANAGYDGKDQFIIRTPYGDGMVEDTTFNVMVLKQDLRGQG